MAVGNDTAAFLRVVAYAASHQVLSRNDVETLAKASDAINPMSLVNCSNPELRFALNEAFESLLRGGAALAWDQIRTGAERIADHLAEQEADRHAARLTTAWLPLPTGNRFFDFPDWATCWSRRDLESFLAFFDGEALYIDTVRGYKAQGKRELRSLFARLFHASDALMEIGSARFGPPGTEIDLDWVRRSRRTPRPGFITNVNEGAPRGNSRLWVEAGRILACVEMPNLNNLAEVALTCPDFGQRAPATAITEALVAAAPVVLLKRLRLKHEQRRAREMDRDA